VQTSSYFHTSRTLICASHVSLPMQSSSPDRQTGGMSAKAYAVIYACVETIGITMFRVNKEVETDERCEEERTW